MEAEKAHRSFDEDLHTHMYEDKRIASRSSQFICL